ncbi:MAG: alpha/beta hydrolase [Hyphomicrobiaceae bacterium]
MTREAGRDWRDIYYTSSDGLRLYGRHYPAAQSGAGAGRRPVLCLPGLTRNSSDFDALARMLTDPANPSARDVFTVDYRGRGRSAHAADWHSYTLQVELADVLDFMTVTGIHGASVIGTSRGGLIAMLMAALRPTSLGAVVLNDIGPVIEREGLLRIVAYVGRVPLPATWSEASALVRDLNARQFPSVPAADWEVIARQWFVDEHGRPHHSYDQDLGKAVGVPEGEMPDLWPQFEALRRFPLLAIRGETSDILSKETLDEMRLRHPNLESWTVKGQGHAPLLRDRATQIVIADFLLRADAHAVAA